MTDTTTGANQATAVAQSMTLVDACLPPLEAGRHEVTVEQTLTKDGREISGKSGDPTFGKKTSDFWVSAPRFALASSEIYAMYPPADARGRFSEAVPHVVLRRRTLPWERSLVAPAGARAGLARPWMALLLLDEDELALNTEAPLKPRSRALKDIFGPKRARAPWERDDEQCLALDIQYSLFRTIAPSWDDLPYLAHARRVGRTAHMEAEGIEDEGWFSVVVGNRSPAPGKEHGAYLVSLEGLEDWLPRENDGSPSASAPGTIRAVVLASWRFVDETKGKGFRALVTGLDCGPPRLPWSHGSGAGADNEVQTALEGGYAPLDHRTRQGHRTVSWYRGPLVPHFLPTDPQNVVYSCADAALRYDRQTGLLDVSYAAAWQLGRLLGLHNESFARAIHRLKLGAVQRAAEAATRKTLADRFGAGAASHWDEIAVTFLQKHPLAQAETTGPADDGTPPPRSDPYEELRRALEVQGGTVELPLEVRQFLGRLFLLHGVPLGYLVPHPRMLPTESLRVFYLDTGWIGALIDGAISIGRVMQSQLFLDRAMAGNFLRDVVRDEIGAGLVKTDALKADGADLGDPNIKEVVGHLTGFLLRSAVISGWPGVEIRAYDDTGPLRALRLQRVAKDTMLAIYDGRVSRLVITQPPQGVHFALADDMPLRGSTRVVRMRQLAVNRGLADRPAQLAGQMLVKRVEHTIDVTIHTARPSSP